MIQEATFTRTTFVLRQVGSKNPVAGPNLLVRVRDAEGHGFIEFEMLNSTTPTSLHMGF